MTAIQRFGVPVALLLLLFGLLAGGGRAAYLREVDHLRGERLRELAAVANLKAADVADWRQDRLLDARFSASGSFFRQAILEWVDHEDEALGERIAARLQELTMLRGYSAAFLLTTDGEPLLTTGRREPRVAPEEAALARRVATGTSARLSDAFVAPGKSTAALSVAAPILDGTESVRAVMVLRSNLAQALLASVATWPGRSLTAETVLIAREGDEVVFLSPLRYRTGVPALGLREPLAGSRIASLQALAAGREGPLDGLDYRGKPVLAEIRRIPGSEWWVVAKIDRAELMVDLREHGLAILAILALAGLLSVAVAFAWMRSRSQRLFRELFESERRQRLAEEIFRATVYSIRDAVVTTDVTGHVRSMNSVASRYTGWDESEALGRPVDTVIQLQNEVTGRALSNPVERVLATSEATDPERTTVLLGRDGSRRPVAVSGTPILGLEGTVRGAVVVLRDLTGERAQELAALAWQRRFEAAAHESGQILYEWDLRRKTMAFYGDLAGIVGHDAASLEGDPARWAAVLHPGDVANYEAMIGRAHAIGNSIHLSYRVRRSDGTIVHLQQDGLIVAGDQPGSQRMIGFIIDVSGRVALERQANERLAELQRWHEMMLGREDRVLDLKAEVNEALGRAGLPPRYDSVLDGAAKATLSG